jgi:hypothetical protein
MYPAVSWVRLPQLPAPAPFLGRDLSRPERETEGQVSRVSLVLEVEVNEKGNLRRSYRCGLWPKRPGRCCAVGVRRAKVRVGSGIG